MKNQILFVLLARIKEKKTPYTSIIIKRPIQEPVNPRKKAKENTLTYLEKSSPSVNGLFERKKTIEHLEAELTGSLTKMDDPSNQPEVQRITCIKANGPVSLQVGFRTTSKLTNVVLHVSSSF